MAIEQIGDYRHGLFEGGLTDELYHLTYNRIDGLVYTEWRMAFQWLPLRTP
ncbi:hypothetical protein [Rhizobium sp. C4]|uniref:hypothetical protein n=1 Tax=Rhizobium sp. C4 TaxID=1349800 RepID=UPI001E46E7A6|nr:hypothetical protein [Rhizobium sp. C4]MCD2175322.1 hypothetical protein [Rhizobium sp. C4]